MNRKLHLEFLRIIAIILVIFNHTGEKGFLLYTIKEDSLFYWFYLYLSIACKIAVPLFWMISGSLLIHKEESISVIYKKRVLRIVLALLVFSLIHYAVPMVKHPEMRIFDAGYFFTRLICSDGFAPAYWYLYAYIGMLLMLPIIQKMAKSMTSKEYMYLFILVFIFQAVVPIIQYFWGDGEVSVNGNLGASIFPQNMIYFIAGYYLENIIESKDLTGRKAIGLFGAGVFAIIISCVATKRMADITGVYSEAFYNCLIFIPTAAVFYLTRYLFIKYADRISNKAAKLLIVLGGASFGVMLMEDLVRAKLQFIFLRLEPHCGAFPACVLWVLATWVCGAAGTLLAKKIPWIKKLL